MFRGNVHSVCAVFFFSSRRRHTRCALVTGVQTCALPILSDALNDGTADGAFDLDVAALAAPLPRAYEFVDGSAYLPHVERVRRARGAQVPESFYTDPLMYQATSAGFNGPPDRVKVVDEGYGIEIGRGSCRERVGPYG